jgi:hypothetical protein
MEKTREFYQNIILIVNFFYFYGEEEVRVDHLISSLQDLFLVFRLKQVTLDNI